MVMHSLYRMVLVAIAVALCLSTPARADQKAHPGQRGARPHRLAPKAAQTHHHPQRHRPPHVSRHEHHSRIRPHRGLSIGIAIGRHPVRPVYPHGHLHHHDAHRRVVIKKHVHHHVLPPPAWHVYHHRHAHAVLGANLHIVIHGHHGDLYVDDRYLGHTQRFHNGGVHVSVPPGAHVIQLRQAGTAYTQHVMVEPHALAVVEARLHR